VLKLPDTANEMLKKYAEYTDYWQRALNAMIPMFNAPPKSIIDIAGNYNIAQLKDLFSVIGSPEKKPGFCTHDDHQR
jgi:hypothetical protein